MSCDQLYNNVDDLITCVVKAAQDRVGTLTSRQIGRGSFCLMFDTLTEKMPSSEFKDFTNYVASSIKVHYT